MEEPPTNKKRMAGGHQKTSTLPNAAVLLLHDLQKEVTIAQPEIIIPTIQSLKQ